jgi:hypothetical protein
VLGQHFGLLARHGAGVEVGHQHGGGLNVGVDHAILLIDGVERRIDGHRGLRRARVGGLVGRAAFLLAGERRAAVFCVDGAVVP